MFYTIYRTTNKINGNIYIGKHKTANPNDTYMGSGKALKLAVKKYGTENFEKEVLFQFDNEQEMNDKERELVNEEFCSRHDTYNLCVGGRGDFSYINQKGLNYTIEKNKRITLFGNAAFREKYQEDIALGSKKGLEKIREMRVNGEL